MMYTRLISFALLCSLLTGCGDEVRDTAHMVTGTVYGSDGKPLKGNAQITLNPAAKDGAMTGLTASSKINNSGKFELKDSQWGKASPMVTMPFQVIPHGTPRERATASKFIPGKYREEEDERGYRHN